MLKERYKEISSGLSKKNITFDLRSLDRDKFSVAFNLKDLIGVEYSKEIAENIGDFSFNFSFLKIGTPSKSDKKIYPYKEDIDYRSRKKWMEMFGGIRIFRDNFRVRPYGEKGDDWLELGKRQAQSPASAGQRLGGYKVRPNQISGEVHISRIKNIYFQDKSGREGMQENVPFFQFKRVLIEIISIFEKDRSAIMHPLRLLWVEKDERERKKAEAEEAKKRVRQKQEERKQSEALTNENEEDAENLADAESLADAFDAQKEELEEKEEELKIVRNLASSGLMLAAISHEIKGMRTLLSTRSSKLKKVLLDSLDPQTFSEKEHWNNPFSFLHDMKKTDERLIEWLDYGLLSLRKDRRKSKKEELKKYFVSFQENWSHILKSRNVDLTIKISETDTKECLSKILLIDLDTIFNNLFINTLENFRDGDSDDRNISINIISENNFNKVVYMDSGSGLSPVFINPDDIFLPFKTTKKNTQGDLIGTGMGMYLLKAVVEDNNGKVELGRPKKGFKITIFLPKAK